MYFLFPFHVLLLVSFQTTGKPVNDYTVEHLEILIIPTGIKRKKQQYQNTPEKNGTLEKRHTLLPFENNPTFR